MNQLENNDIVLGDKIIGEKTIIAFNLKTLTVIMVILYSILGWFYLDLRSELKDSVEISTEEKAKFLKEVESEFDSKLDQIQEITTTIRIDQAKMQGDIKVILDRDQRISKDEKQTNTPVNAVKPPGQ